MKKILHTFILILITILIAPDYSSAWGNDIMISSIRPGSKHSIAAKQNGTLYASIAGTAPGADTLSIYTSTDNGLTWIYVPLSTVSGIGNIVTTKLVRTFSDSIYCAFQSATIIYFVNVESGVLGQFNQSMVEYFDIATSSFGDAIYLFVDEYAVNSIRRYGTLDGGLTWTGNTALVTSQGTMPSVYMSGTRLFLSYYGPVLPDTASSEIRIAFYDESVPGNITPGTFQDVVTNTAVKKKQFQAVSINNTVWFLYTENDVQQVLKCRTSTDNGVTYSPETTIATVDAHWFGATHYSNATGTGLTLTWFEDSIPSGSIDQMVYATAQSTSPTVFTQPAPPLNTYNDTTIVTGPIKFYPSVINYSYSSNSETGIAWVGSGTSNPVVYFDRFSNTVGLPTIQASYSNMNIFPVPASDHIMVSFELTKPGQLKYEVLSIEGKTTTINFTKTSPAGFESLNIDTHSLQPGYYLLRISDNRSVNYFKFMIINNGM
jgi:hypothetical protein